ncbi:MAG: AAA family ATPase [Legionellales bacterium]|nr:AAA family ATPase [Legionellales bacterium]
MSKKPLPFVGRSQALRRLTLLLDKNAASLVVVKGRRRIGKSRLIEEFAKPYRFLSFAGLPPEKNITAQDQRDAFAKRLGLYCQFPSLRGTDWADLFQMLAEQTRTGRVIILLDEISWMAQDDPTFLGKLKNSWDLELKKNTELILILCGSVSVWIENNILSSTGYFGRIPTEINLQELSLAECNQLIESQQFRGSNYEKFQILSITGGVPWYLEQLQPGFSAEQNIKNLCFTEGGVLVKEFDRIFHDLFDEKAVIYKNIVKLLANGSLENKEIAEKLAYPRSGVLTHYLQQLTISNFITRDRCWHLRDGKYSRLSKYRLSDNYLRYYLKFIEPNLEKIERGDYETIYLGNFPGYSTTLGYQFENLVIKNRKTLFKLLEININEVLSDNPYFQHKTNRQKGCQIDYMIQTRLNTLFIIEIKFSKNTLDYSVVSEVQEKIQRLSKPHHFSTVPVLVHVNGVNDAVTDAGYFYKIIDFSELLL